jgi:hypothetical protein
LPHAPQFAMSLDVLMHSPMQAIVPAGHALHVLIEQT